MKNLYSLISWISCIIIFTCFVYQFNRAKKWKDRATQYQQNGINYLEKCNEVTGMQLAGLKALDSIIQLKDAELQNLLNTECFICSNPNKYRSKQ